MNSIKSQTSTLLEELPKFKNRNRTKSGNGKKLKYDKTIRVLLNKKEDKEDDFKTVTIKELPEWLMDNVYIHNGYRPPLDSYWKCIKSIFRIHTETVNIWSHLLGAIFINIIIFGIIMRKYFSNDPSLFYPNGNLEYLLFGIYAISCSFCYGFSSMFHTFQCHSEASYSRYAKFDYCGISIKMIGSMIPLLHFMFYCQRHIFINYSIFFSCIALFYIILLNTIDFSKPNFRKVRVVMFLLLGFFSLIPVYHFIYENSLEEAVRIFQFNQLIRVGMAYSSGAFIYAMLIPERYISGKISILFQSHQFHHFFVLLGSFLYLKALCMMSNYRALLGNVCPISG